jgi:hypothetical protein
MAFLTFFLQQRVAGEGNAHNQNASTTSNLICLYSRDYVLTQKDIRTGRTPGIKSFTICSLLVQTFTVGSS